MSVPAGIHQFRALYAFIFVLVLFLAFTATLPILQLKGSLMDIASEDASRDLGMLESLTREAMIRHDYSAIEETFTYWGQENVRVLDIRAVAPNGFVIAEFHRPAEGPHPDPVSVGKQIRQDERILATIQLSEDFALFAHEAGRVVTKVVLSFVVFTVMLGIVLWLTLRRTAVVPMQNLLAEVNTLNLTLEERVSSRTAELTRANQALEREIAERLTVEEYLKESEERYRSIIASAADGVFLFEPAGPDGPVIVEANEAACRMHGYLREELLGKAISFLDADKDKAFIRERVQSLQADKRISFEVTHVRKDGSTFPLDVSARLVSFKGRPYIISIERDITERRESEELLKRSKEALERQNEELKKIDRMKDALLRDVSHELKTPVAKHAMQLEILRPLFESDRTGVTEQRAFAVMEESIRRQESSIRNLLNLDRLESGGRQYTKETFRLDKLVEKVLGDYAETIESRGIAVMMNMEEVSIRSDIEMLWHVFSNLLGNAIKFQRREGLPKILISTRAQVDSATVRIEDNGVGMSPEARERVFTRFYQASASVEGSGVGLTICKRIVEDLGGDMRIESEGIGRGSAAEVTLPLS